MEDNLSAVLYGAKDFRLEQRPHPGKPKENEVLLSIERVGICGTDLHHFQYGALGDFKLKEPMVLGHESSATVIQVGRDVKHLVLDCPTDHVSLEEGALVEPLSVGVYAVQKTKLQPNNSLLICGAGTIGLVCLLCAKAVGVEDILITDLDDNRLNFALKLGAKFTYKIDRSKTSEENARSINSTFSCMPQVALECSGAESSIKTAIYATESGGLVGLVGLGPANVNLPIVNAAIREIDILSIFRYPGCFPTALSLVASGKVDVKPLVSHRFALEKIHDAFETARNGKTAIKVVVDCSSRK